MKTGAHDGKAWGAKLPHKLFCGFAFPSTLGVKSLLRGRLIRRVVSKEFDQSLSDRDCVHFGRPKATIYTFVEVWGSGEILCGR